MAAAVIPILTSVASAAVGAIFMPKMEMPDAPTLPAPPALNELPMAPAVINEEADAQQQMSASALAQKQRLQKLNQYTASLNKKGQLSNNTPNTKTLLGD